MFKESLMLYAGGESDTVSDLLKSVIHGDRMTVAHAKELLTRLPDVKETAIAIFKEKGSVAGEFGSKDSFPFLGGDFPDSPEAGGLSGYLQAIQYIKHTLYNAFAVDEKFPPATGTGDIKERLEARTTDFAKTCMIRCITKQAATVAKQHSDRGSWPDDYVVAFEESFVLAYLSKKMDYAIICAEKKKLVEKYWDDFKAECEVIYLERAHEAMLGRMGGDEGKKAQLGEIFEELKSRFGKDNNPRIFSMEQLVV